MPAKKAAKKAAKKVAAKHKDPKHHERKDLRRAYEHLGRVESLHAGVTGDASGDVKTLVLLAEKELQKGHRKDAADLLRAAEHLSFAAMARAGARPGKTSAELKDIVTEEVKHLTRKAHEHWDEHDDSQHHVSVAALFLQSLEAAVQALAAGSFREALELSRGAEALAHVKKHGPDRLDSEREHRKLPKP